MRFVKDDLTGKKFHRFFVIGEDKERKTKNRSIKWKWLCDCGRETSIRSDHLKSGRTKSCGCFHRERASNVRKELNKKSSLPKGQAHFNRMYSDYKRKAKERSICFEFSKEQFFLLTQENCHYCGSSPAYFTPHKGMNGAFIGNGVDRKDNSAGYTEENSVTCCFTCNSAKRALSYKEFILWVCCVYYHIGKTFYD
jgi:hypothetical protein